jgi:carboxypeptidase T
MKRLFLSFCVGLQLFSSQALASISKQAAANRTYGDVQAVLKDIAKRHPVTAKVINLGKNDTGEIIQALKAGVGPIHNVIVATHHGNEYGSTEVALAMAESLAEKPIQGQTIFVIPVLNVSGYNAKRRWELNQDPNRNYPGPCGTEGPFTLKSTQILADLLRNQNIVVSATLHTHSPAVLYPWGFSTNDLSTRYDGIYIDLAKAATLESGYAIGNSTALLYPADGAYEDYAMIEYGIWSMLFELGFTHSPNQSDIDDLIRVNVPGLRRYFEQAPVKRAEFHAFEGKCDTSKRLLGIREE